MFAVYLNTAKVSFSSVQSVLCDDAETNTQKFLLRLVSGFLKCMKPKDIIERASSDQCTDPPYLINIVSRQIFGLPYSQSRRQRLVSPGARLGAHADAACCVQQGGAVTSGVCGRAANSKRQ